MHLKSGIIPCFGRMESVDISVFSHFSPFSSSFFDIFAMAFFSIAGDLKKILSVMRMVILAFLTDLYNYILFHKTHLNILSKQSKAYAETLIAKTREFLFYFL